MDHILLETTGFSDPAPLVSVLWLDGQLESSIRLDSFITVESWLEDLLWEKKSSIDIYRCKGILHIHDSDQVHTLQSFTTYSYNNQEGLHYELGLSSIFLSDFPL